MTLQKNCYQQDNLYKRKNKLEDFLLEISAEKAVLCGQQVKT